MEGKRNSTEGNGHLGELGVDGTDLKETERGNVGCIQLFGSPTAGNLLAC